MKVSGRVGNNLDEQKPSIVSSAVHSFSSVIIPTNQHDIHINIGDAKLSAA